MAFLASQSEKLNRIIVDAVENNATPSLVFGAANVGETRFIYAGSEDPSNPSAEMVNEESIFWICSTAKMIVTIAALQLIEQGKITLDTLVSDILPEIGDPVIVDFTQDSRPTIGPAKTPITFKHLLTHTSGLSYNEPARVPPFALLRPYTWAHDKKHPISHFLTKLKGDHSGLPLKFEPGTDFAYGYSTDLVGFIIERVSGKSLEEFLKQHILLPLGITSSLSFYLTPDLKHRKMDLRFREEDGRFTSFANRAPLVEQDPSKVSLHLGGTALYSSMKDYLTVCQHLLQIHAECAVDPILKPESVRKLFEPTLSGAAVNSVSVMVGKPSQWSLGLCLNTTDWPGMRKSGSGHWYGWLGTYFFIDLKCGIALVLATQILPEEDVKVKNVWMELEKTVYAGLEV